MIGLQNTIFALLLMLSPHIEDKDEPDNDRSQRMQIIASAITDASRDTICNGTQDPNYCWNGTEQELAVLLTTKGWFETKYNKRLHMGKCYDQECDPIWKSITDKHGKTTRIVVGWRARTPWQIHYQQFMPKSEWAEMIGDSKKATYLAASNAAKILAFGMNRCGGYSTENKIERAMAMYATGKHCSWKGTKNRMYVYQSLMKKSQDESYVSGVLMKHQQDIKPNDWSTVKISFWTSD